MHTEGIKYNSFIEITQTPVERPQKLSKLATLLITQVHAHTTVPEWLEVTSVDEVHKYYGYSPVHKFATNYFGYKNRAGDSPDTLYILNWAKAADAPPALVGNNTPSLDDLKKVNGKFSITINQTQKDITLNLAGKNDHTAMATEIANAIKKDNGALDGFKDAHCEWSSTYSAFIIKAGAGSKYISFIGTPSDGEDVSGMLGLTEADGARTTEPYSKIEDLLSLLTYIEKANKKHFFITFDFEFTDLQDLTTAGEWVHNTNNEYSVLYLTTNPAITTQYNFTQKWQGYSGLVIEYSPSLAITNGKSAGIMSSIDYSLPNGNINLGYINVPELRENSIREKEAYEMVVLHNRANAFVTVSRLTKGHTWYMQGNVMGKDTEYLNVYIGNFVIKTMLQMDFADWLTNTRFASSADSNVLELVVHNTMSKVRGVNLITTLDELEQGERQQIGAVFNNLRALEQSLKADGFFVEVGHYDPNKKCVNIKLVYVVNTPIRKICIKMLPLRGN